MSEVSAGPHAPGGYVSNGQIFYFLPDGTTLSCNCIRGPYAALVGDALTTMQIRARHDEHVQLLDEMRISASLADELAFWRHQAIFYCACVGGYLSDPSLEKLRAAASGIPEQWLKEAETRLEKVRTEENRERT